jgi:hypothetical protein
MDAHLALQRKSVRATKMGANCLSSDFFVRTS